VKKANSTDVDKVIAAMAGQTFKAPSGIVSKMDEKNHHLHKSVFIGEIKADGQFNVVWKTPGPVKAKPWCGQQQPHAQRDRGRAGGCCNLFSQRPRPARRGHRNPGKRRR
jgi:hypothetical protein